MAKSTRTHICPHLGLKSDPTTALHFASVGNYCHHVNPPEVVKETHQTAFCLTADYVNCPVYKMAAGGRLPRKFRSKSAVHEVKKLQIGTVPIVIGLVLLVVGAFVFLQLNNPNGIFSTDPKPIATLTPNGAVILTQTPIPSQEAFRPFCQPPPSWHAYLVGQNDTFITLSITYGRPIEQLMTANCRSSITDLTPGERIYLPELADCHSHADLDHYTDSHRHPSHPPYARAQPDADLDRHLRDHSVYAHPDGYADEYPTDTPSSPHRHA